MAQFTMTLRQLTQTCDIGLQDYPIWDESYRERLNTVIVNHFMFREISAPTPMAFVYKLNAKMYEIMPKYNMFYQLQDNMKLSLMNVDLETEVGTTDNRTSETDMARDNSHKTTSDTNESSVKQDASASESETITSSTGSNSNTSSTTSSNRERFSDTPQGLLANSDLEGDTYLTSLKLDNGSDSTTDSGTTTTSGSNTNNSASNSESAENGRKHSSSDYQQEVSEVTSKSESRRGSTTTHKKGIDKLSEAKILAEYYDAIHNIDLMIIHELECLFIQLLH